MTEASRKRYFGNIGEEEKRVEELIWSKIFQPRKGSWNLVFGTKEGKIQKEN